MCNNNNKDIKLFLAHNISKFLDIFHSEFPSAFFGEIQS